MRRDLIFATLLGAVFYYGSQLCYSRGADYVIGKWSKNSYGMVKKTFLQNPPTIYSNCFSFCEDKKDATWEEYVKQYQEHMRSK